MAAKATGRTRHEPLLRGSYPNTGADSTFQVLDIGHERYMAVLAPETAFWALVRKEKLAEALSGRKLLDRYLRKLPAFTQEVEALRFGIKPSAVYFNPTDRCNLNCTYCYIPPTTRRRGRHMSASRLLDALGRLAHFFKDTQPPGAPPPQMVFHGAEPLLNRDAVFAGIDAFAGVFRFGIQTNATLLDENARNFLLSRDVGIGISLDAPIAEIADRTRHSWAGKGAYATVVSAMERLRDYPRWSVITTITRENMRHLPGMVEFLHAHHVPAAMLNVLRCTMPASRAIKPPDRAAASHFLAAIDRAHELYARTGRKLVIANFANTLTAILAPTARRLMCDISPCGAGRCFFAVAANGDVFPCSEFVGLPVFRAGNIFEDDLAVILESEACKSVTSRRVEDIEACKECAIRHFCGAPCPAEAHAMNGSVASMGGFCEFYQEQVRYALRVIADGTERDFLWDGWERGTSSTFALSTLQ